MLSEVAETIGFSKAHELAERLYSLQTKQADQVLAMIISLTSTVAGIKTDVALIQTNTKDLPGRVLVLENLRFKAAAFIAAVLFLLWTIQVAMPYLKH